MSFAFLSPVRGWRVVFLLAAAALLNPGEARAGCGDYITYPDGHKQHATADHAATDGSAPAPAKPCQGPNCSGAPNREAPAPPAPVTNPLKEHARLIATLDANAADSDSPFDRDHSPARPIRRANSVFHPPRLG